MVLEPLQLYVSNRDPRRFHTAKATYDMMGSPIMFSAQRPVQDCVPLSQLRWWCVEGCGTAVVVHKAGVFEASARSRCVQEIGGPARYQGKRLLPVSGWRRPAK